MKKSIIIPLSLTIMSVNSEMVMAVEKTSSSSSFAGWPLIALVVLLVVFRKQLFAEATVDQPDTDNQDVAVAAKKVTEAKVEPEVSTTKA
ncbi:MAG: hypothetical protein KAT04_07120, partial [Methylococcales bacterium]|nr:hypothetical protein [Methylococcales bacterium]